MASLCTPRSALLSTLTILLTLSAAHAADDKKLLFNRDIRPILSENCYRCHGPDKGNRKGKLRLDQREAAIAKAIVPGKPDESEAIKRIFSTDTEELMPPPESNKHLTADQKEMLKRWILSGAEYEPHWAYIPIHRPETPVCKKQDWVRNPIDSFILHGLEQKNIMPSAEADKRTLLRRLSLDLIGLPPSPDEVASFIADNDPNSYEHAVDRLLASPHYGERMAVPWLDAVRFSDTVGYHGDQNVNVFPYRDYVINAFNANKHFDQFTIEQLAGDLLPNPTIEQRVATGFNRLNMVTREGGAQPKEYLAKYAADRVRTLSGAWLGSTMGCCECHDHKYDPFTTRDFYSMEAFFADIKEWGVYQDYGYTPNPDLKGWSNDHPFPPEIEVESPYLKQRLAKLRNRVSETVKAANAKLESDVEVRTAYSKWRGEIAEFLKSAPDGWLSPEPVVAVKESTAAKKIEKARKDEKKDAKAGKPEPTSADAPKPEAAPHFTMEKDGSVLLNKGTFEVSLGSLPPRIAAIRMQVIPDSRNGGSVLLNGAKSDTIKLSATLKKKSDNSSQSLSFRFADANYKQFVYRNGYSIIGTKSEWKIGEPHLNDLHVGFWLLDSARSVAPGDTLTIRVPDSTLGRVKISVSPLAFESDLSPDFDRGMLAALANPNDTPDTQELVHECYLRSTGWNADAFTDMKNLENEMLECRGAKGLSVITETVMPRTIRVLPRGNWQDDSGDILEPNVPKFLPQIPSPEKRRLTRLDLAKWLIAPENPLTSRALTNRMWKQFFGTGISAVVDDLGGQGEWPVNPELLDWLAVEFRESGWDVKHLVKLMVMSSAYRQISNLRQDLKEIDPANRLVASQSPRRLEAEFVRDNALSIAGLLNLDLGGPSAKPYQPAGYYAAIQFPNRDYKADTDDRQYRRGLYMHWQRTFLHPMLANFDAPARDESVCTRNCANTPQQALTLLNDPEFVEAARVFAQTLLGTSAASDGDRIDMAFEKALSRQAKPKEKESLTAFLAGRREHYKSGADDPRKLIAVGLTPVPEKVDPVELASWTEVCRVVINLHETITRY